MLKIEADLLRTIEQHAEAEYPHECCGLLIGHIADEGRTRIVAETYPVTNAWHEEGERDHRMLISPEDYIRAELKFSRQGLGVVGDYHSHPDDSAVPSQFDLEHSPWPTMSYIVISVRAGRAEELRSWEMAEDRSRFTEEEILKGS